MAATMFIFFPDFQVGEKERGRDKQSSFLEKADNFIKIVYCLDLALFLHSTSVFKQLFCFADGLGMGCERGKINKKISSPLISQNK